MIKFNCPACGQKIEATDEVQNQRLKCPSCDNEFVPTAPPLMPKKFSKVDDIRNTAGNFRAFAIFFAALGFLILGCQFFAAFMASVDVRWCVVGVLLLTTSFWFYLIAQIMHIRANTHR